MVLKPYHHDVFTIRLTTYHNITIFVKQKLCEGPKSSLRGCSAAILLPQVGFAHEELIDAAGGLAAFGDGPDYQRLAAAHITGGEHAGYGRQRCSLSRIRCSRNHHTV